MMCEIQKDDYKMPPGMWIEMVSRVTLVTCADEKNKIKNTLHVCVA